MTDPTKSVDVAQADRMLARQILAWAHGLPDDAEEMAARAIRQYRIEATRTPPGESEFKPGDRVLKVEGYPFGTGDAVVLVAYRCASGTGPWRYVVEHPEGWQHIFSGKQLAPSSPRDRT